MAENKESFILYADLIHTIGKLPDVEAGLLFKHILKYVNDENPTTDNILVEIAFEPIKQQLKRDLRKWDEFKKKQSENGKLGGRPRKEETQEKPKNPSLNLKSQKSLNVNVNANVNDNVNVKKKRVDFVPPTIAEVMDYFKENGYRMEIATKAFHYYNTSGWKDSKGNQVKNWKQKMIAVWFTDENKLINIGHSIPGMVY